MISQDEADEGFDLLKMAIAGLAEDAVDLAAAAWGAHAQSRRASMTALAGLGRDIAKLAEAAVVMIEGSAPTSPEATL
jgi:hypothetical protein